MSSFSIDIRGDNGSDGEIISLLKLPWSWKRQRWVEMRVHPLQDTMLDKPILDCSIIGQPQAVLVKGRLAVRGIINELVLSNILMWRCLIDTDRCKRGQGEMGVMAGMVRLGKMGGMDQMPQDRSWFKWDRRLPRGGDGGRSHGSSGGAGGHVEITVDEQDGSTLPSSFIKVNGRWGQAGRGGYGGSGEVGVGRFIFMD